MLQQAWFRESQVTSGKLNDEFSKAEFKETP